MPPDNIASIELKEQTNDALTDQTKKNTNEQQSTKHEENVDRLQADDQEEDREYITGWRLHVLTFA